jgi:hypothetical protein
MHFIHLAKRMLILIGSLAILLSACKIQPNLIRSEPKSSTAFKLIDRDSIGFQRRPDPTSGDFYFQLKDDYRCRVEYWAEDLSSSPNAQAPMSLKCPADQRKHNFTVTDLKPGIPYSFKISVWPQNLSPQASTAVIFRESRSLSNEKTNHMVFARYVGPRRSSEIYTYQFAGETNLLEIRQTFIDHYQRSGSYGCGEDDLTAETAYPRYNSLETGDDRPFHGLGRVATDGYGRGQADAHPFFDTRLSQTYSDINRQTNWDWYFEWENEVYQFTTYPPGYLESINLINGDRVAELAQRDLSGATSVVELHDDDLKLELSPMFPADLSFAHIRFRDPFDAAKSFYCSFPVEESQITIPADLVRDFPAGKYDFTVIFETIQIHFEKGTPYPPWIIASQDWVHSQINKRF